ncbi:MAG: discoidin domain-containing protein [Candidatus Nitrosocosmicus sp.]|nr:discoidin domain-containing protein [Candidatus Nitrosocosmicus sp.]
MTFLTNATVTVSGNNQGTGAFDINDNTSWIGEKGDYLEFNFDTTVNIDKIEIKGKGTFNVDLLYYAGNTFNLFGQIQVKGNKDFEVFDVDKFVNITKVRVQAQSDKVEIIDIRFVSEACNCCKTPCECEEHPSPPEPTPEPEDKGRVKEGGWGSVDDNPNNWKVVHMKDDNRLLKVVDKDGVNVADNFKTLEGAKKFIAEAIKNYKPKPEPKPTPTPQPSGQNVTKDGVQLLYKPKEISYKHSQNFRDDGKRYDFNCGENKNFTNVELIGYFRFKDGKAVDDEISGKCRGGEHHSGSSPKTYDMGIEIKTGKARYRTEDKHPEYEKGTAKDTESGQGIPLKGKFVGYKFVCKNAEDNKSVNLQIWQDQGDNEGEKPANAWKLISNWNVTKPLWLIPPKDHQETLRVDDPGKNGQKNLEIKWEACSGF